MKCPYCGGKSGVLDTRSSKNYIYRRRVCWVCRKNFSTREYYAPGCVTGEASRDLLEQYLRTLHHLVKSWGT